MKIWSSQQRLFRGSEVWGLYVIKLQIQLEHQYLAGDKEVAWAISLHFKCGQKEPNPGNCYTGAMSSAAAGCVGATGFCLFTPYTAIWKTKSITWKTVAPAGGMEMGAVNNCDASVAPDALSVSDWGSHSDNCHHPPQRRYICIPNACCSSIYGGRSGRQRLKRASVTVLAHCL